MNDLIDGCKITGDIKYNGQDINNINTILLRTKVVMVFQQPNPFPMSIRNNTYVMDHVAKAWKIKKNLTQLLNNL